MISSEKGYKVSIIHKGRTVLKVRVWGLWDVEDTELAENFKRELKEKVKEVSVNGKEWDVCGDLSELYPQSKEVCRIMGDGIMFAIKHGMKKAVHLES
jgi:serine/threonine-protein kinase